MTSKFYALILGLLLGLPMVAQAAITDNLVAYYKLDEASSGNRSDSYSGGYTLTAQNAPGYEAAKISNGCLMVSASNQSLYSFDSAFQFGDADFSASFWLYVDSFTAYDHYVLRCAAGHGDWTIEYDQPSNRFRMRVFGAASFGSTGTLTANTLGAPSTGVWYHIVGMHDSVNNEIRMYINNVAETPVSHSAGVYSSAGPFAIGAYPFAADVDGTFDEVGIWSRCLTTDEIAYLYNSGAGRTYPFSGTEIVIRQLRNLD